MTQQHRYFHLTIGPVQAFVAQARRTRDFWAGSFLLSWLSGVAMVAVRQSGGEVTFPIPGDDFLAWIANDDKPSGRGPQQGSVPNRFKAMTARVRADFEPQWVVDAIRNGWKGVADAVWQQDLEPVLDPAQRAITREIWDRQVNHFFEVSWVLTDEEHATNLLDCRKNWRSHAWPTEPGVSCMLMDGFQELSGADRPVRGLMNRFWDVVRSGGVRDIDRDVREGEHLCALAFIKRRFAACFEQVAVPMGGWTAHGWEVGTRVPSLAHVASGSWLANAVAKLSSSNNLQPLTDFVDRASLLPDLGSERGSVLPSVRAAMSTAGVEPRMLELDAQCWYPFLLEQEPVINRKRRLLSDASSALDRLIKQVGVAPSPYFAVLLMDGDSLGAQMSDASKQRAISSALNQFTALVPEVVARHSGFLVYAGGDDVLALLGVADALPCAKALRETYLNCFAEQNRVHQLPQPVTTTLSGAINIGHIKMPLRQLLFDAHPLLDDVAKDQAGRDALAVRVWKQGLKNITFAAPWKSLLLDGGEDRISKLVNEFGNGVISNGFFQKLADLVDELGLARAGDAKKGDKQEDAVLHGLIQQAGTLLRAEYLHSQGRDGKAPEIAWFNELLALCRVYTRVIAPEERLTDTGNINADAALMIRFLLMHGISRGMANAKESVAC